MIAHITAPPLTVRIRADIDIAAADDLVSSLRVAGWEGTGMRVPRVGPPEVIFPLTGVRVTLRRLVRSLPCLLDAWRLRHDLASYELTVSRGVDQAVRTVMTGDPDRPATRALIAGITEVIGGPAEELETSTG